MSVVKRRSDGVPRASTVLTQAFLASIVSFQHVSLARAATPAPASPTVAASPATTPARLERREGYVNTGDAMIYYVTIGSGPPLVLLHGGPGASHDYFLPYVLPLAKNRQLVLIDERGCGRSQRLDDPTQYNLDAMAQDVEAVRVALGLGQVDLLGHSFGGILAQAVAVNHPAGVRRLILASTGSSATRINADFKQIKDSLDPDLRKRIETLEASGIIGPDGAQLPEYRKLADEAEGPYSYFGRLPAWDSAASPLGWDVLNQMWGAKSDFHIDGNLVGFDFTAALRELTIPALVVYGERDLVSDATARESHDALAGSKLVEIPRSAHNTFVDQNSVFVAAVSQFLDAE
jgi:proline iminopeptidase